MAGGQQWDAEDVYRRHAPAVLAYLRAADVSAHEDVFGEVWVKVARSIRRFDGDGDALRRWLFTIARNALLDDRRRRARRPREVASLERVEPPVTPPAEPFDPALVFALRTLTGDQREVVVLRFVVDLSLDDVARVTKRSVGAVKALQHRGLDALASALGGARVIAPSAADPSPS